MSIHDYQGYSTERREGNDKTFFKIYNDSGATLNQGQPYAIVEKVISGRVEKVAIAPATNDADVNLIGLPVDDIADANYGEVQVQGIYVNPTGAITSGTVNANDQLEVLTTGTALIDQGTNGGAVEATETVAVAIANITTNRWSVKLLGKRSSIKGS